MDYSEVIKKATELNSLSEEFTLSHAVLATARMIEKQKESSKVSGEDIDDMLLNSPLEDYEKIYEKRLNRMTDGKVYISVSNLLVDKSKAQEARTFYYERIVPPKTGCFGESRSEHFEILLPPKTNEDEMPVSYDKNRNISKGSNRFLVGHELGHLWLHLDEVRRLINNIGGTQLLSHDKILESEATIFSNKLSEFRDEHIKKMAEFIKRNGK